MKNSVTLFFPILAFVVICNEAQAFTPSCTYIAGFATTYYWKIGVYLIALCALSSFFIKPLRKDKLTLLFNALVSLFIILLLIATATDSPFGRPCDASDFFRDRSIVERTIILVSFISFLISFWALYGRISVIFMKGLKGASNIKKIPFGLIHLHIGVVGIIYTLSVIVLLQDTYTTKQSLENFGSGFGSIKKKAQETFV